MAVKPKNCRLVFRKIKTCFEFIQNSLAVNYDSKILNFYK